MPGARPSAAAATDAREERAEDRRRDRRRGTGRALLLAALLATAACAHAPCDVAPAPGWRRIRTDHFVIYSDANDGTVARVASRLEDMHRAFSTYAFPGARLPEMAVLLPRGGAEFERLTRSERLVGYSIDGMFLPLRNGVLHGILVVRVHDDGLANDETVAHELAHRFIAAAVPGAPVWFHEGLATYLETVRFKGGAAAFGYPPGRLAVEIRNGSMAPLGNLFSVPESEIHGSVDYHVTAWLLFRYLYHGPDPDLRGRLDTLVQGLVARKPAAEAVGRAFGDIGVPAFDARMRKYGSALALDRRVHVRGVEIPFELRTPPRTEPASPEEVRGVCSAVRARGRSR